MYRARYPASPAPGPIPPVSAPLREHLLRLALGDVRKGGRAPVSLRSGEPADAAGAVTVRVRGSGGVEYSAGLTRGQLPGVWFDFRAPGLEQLDCVVEVLLDGAPLGRAAVLGRELRSGKGVAERALLQDDGRIGGAVLLSYLVVAPFDFDRVGGRARFGGPKGRTDGEAAPIFAGHRGVGKTCTTYVQENTLLSFVVATRGPRVKHVELDVQLTKDGHPVVYHDYFVGKDENGQGGVPIYSLKLDQLKSVVDKGMGKEDGGYDSDHGGKNKSQRRLSKSYSLDERRRAKRSSSDDVEVLHGKLRDHVPSLKHVCRWVPKDVGLLVEIKYPAPELAQEQVIPYPERNYIVDQTLHRIFKEDMNFDRPVTFLTFDPDIAMMLKLKQDMHPVYFLHCEGREKDTDTFDPRCTSFDDGLEFAVTQGLHGMVLLADMILEDESLVKRIRSMGLKVMTYGRVNMTPAKSQRQLELGVNGIIADNVCFVAGKVPKSLLATNLEKAIPSDSSDTSESVYSLITSASDDFEAE